jgi:hypothetical protein
MNTRFPCLVAAYPEGPYHGFEYTQLYSIPEILIQAHFFIDGLPPEARLDDKINRLVVDVDALEGLMASLATLNPGGDEHGDGEYVYKAKNALELGYSLNKALCEDLVTPALYIEAGIEPHLYRAEQRVGTALPEYRALVDEIKKPRLYHDIRDLENYKFVLRMNTILDSLKAPAFTPNAIANNDNSFADGFGKGAAAGTGGALLLATVVLLAMRTPTAKYLYGKASSFANAVASRLCIFSPRVEAATDEEQASLNSTLEWGSFGRRRLG